MKSFNDDVAERTGMKEPYASWGSGTWEVDCALGISKTEFCETREATETSE